VSPEAGAPGQRSERIEMRETCSSCSESSPDGELPSAAAARFAFTAEAAGPARGRAFPPRCRRGVFVLSIAPPGGGPRARERTSDPPPRLAAICALSRIRLLGVGGFEAARAEGGGLTRGDAERGGGSGKGGEQRRGGINNWGEN